MYYYHRGEKTETLSTNYADRFLLYLLNKKSMPNLQLWDIKYYYWVHCARQTAQGNTPLSYSWFQRRLRKWMNLHDAIYTPRVEYQVRDKKLKPTIQDAIRRREIEKIENIQIVDFRYMKKVENNHYHSRRKKNRIDMKPKKKTLLQRFISLFR